MVEPSADGKVAHYVDCAFNFTDGSEGAFLFTADQCLQFNYATGTTLNYIIKDPVDIGDLFPSLIDTDFAKGIDSAFTLSANNEVYMFRGKQYVRLNFVSGVIIEGPKKITHVFPSLKGTVFNRGIDAAFASHQSNEAYIFKGDQYARIRFTDGVLLDLPQKITNTFTCLKDTVFKDGLDAAFKARAENEAYIFKGNRYALINYAQGETGDYIIHEVFPISKGFQSLEKFIPHYC